MKTNLLTILLAAATLAGCSTNKIDESQADTLSVSENSTAPDRIEPMLVKTTDIRFKVADAVNASSKISSLTRQLGGVVMHNEMKSLVSGSNTVPIAGDSLLVVTSSSANVEMTVRVPTERMDVFIDSVTGLATHVESRISDIEDRTFDYVANELKRRNREKARPTDEAKTGVWLKDQPALLTRDEKSELIVNNLRTRAEVRYSTVSLAFYQDGRVQKERIANPDPGSYRIALMHGLGLSLKNGWQIFESVLIALANFWVLFVIGLAGFAGWKWYARKQRKPVGV